jgi:hypothetical protein
MRGIALLTGFSLLLALAGCQRNDEQIQTYRVSKDSDAVMPMPAPMMGGGSGGAAPDMQSMGAGMGMTAAASPKEITWKVPSGWQEQPPSAMRVGSFLVKGSHGYSADVSVIPLSGDAGGELANINRWRAQIQLGPASEADLPQFSQTINAGGRAMRLVDMVSREPLVDNRYPKRLIAAIYQQGSRSWFFKMTGEDQTVEEAKPAFLSFLKSLQFHG